LGTPLKFGAVKKGTPWVKRFLFPGKKAPNNQSFNPKKRKIFGGKRSTGQHLGETTPGENWEKRKKGVKKTLNRNPKREKVPPSNTEKMGKKEHKKGIWKKEDGENKGIKR